ncbi:unnamed protein product [Moneuplotes crassus]|uniref:Uncharacterized protein n=1 Tax=Euplotes crassus TaxID=5936 RepID=A0AAD1XWL7_EUPCR|nr:unnamed protein product [Moneuplotes crassus]
MDLLQNYDSDSSDDQQNANEPAIDPVALNLKDSDEEEEVTKEAPEEKQVKTQKSEIKEEIQPKSSGKPQKETQGTLPETTEERSTKRVKVSEEEEMPKPVAPKPQKKVALPSVGGLFKNFKQKLNCLQSSKYDVYRKLHSLSRQKDMEREQKDHELEMQRRKEFTDKNIVEEVIEFKGDNYVDEEMLRDKMKPKKENQFVKNPMERTSFEIRKARREKREEILNKLE